MRDLSVLKREKPALLGGPQTVSEEPGDLFAWPIVTAEHEAAVLAVLRARAMSGTDITRAFEREYADAIGMKYALACNNGTAAIHCALYGMGVGVGDEVICPTITYWASALPLYSLGATPVFADIDPATLCIDPAGIERHISPRTKAIIVVHYAGMPADMDPILALAAKHNLPVFEDGSHAQGGLYKGRQIGTMGVASGFSLMTGKSLAIGEGGILFTNDRAIYERAVLFGHYERHGEIEDPALKWMAGLPCGGYKYRMHQASSAFGRVQLKLYPRQMAAIDKAMNRFCDLIEGTPGLRPIRPPKGSGSSNAGWYAARIGYDPDALGGLSARGFAKAVAAEGSTCSPGCNTALHLHPVFTRMDVYGHCRPTRTAHLPANVNIEQTSGALPVAEGIQERVCAIPWFKHDRPRIIEQHAEAYVKAAWHATEFLLLDKQQPRDAGVYSTFLNR